MGDAFAAVTIRVRNAAAIWWKYCPKFRKNLRFSSFGTDFAPNSSEDQKVKI